MARPSKKYDAAIAEKIKSMAANGSSQAHIAYEIGLSENTMRKIYRNELKFGAAQANFAVAKTLFGKCMEGDTACLIFWAKTRMGWSEKASFIGREILERFKNGELPVKDAALELEMNGLPLPDTIRILLAKEQPDPIDVTRGEYCIISDDEMEAMLARKKAEISAQRNGLPERRAEMAELHKQVQDKHAPGGKWEDAK